MTLKIKYFDGAAVELGVLPIEAIVTDGTTVWIKISGNWRVATPWVKVAGVWKTSTPYIKISGTWKG